MTPQSLLLLNLAVQIFFLIIFVILLFYMGYILITFKNLVPFVPTPYKIIRRMIAAAEIKEKEKIIDLGSGSGRIVFEVVRNYPVETTGIEKSILLLTLTRIMSLFHRKKGRLNLLRGNIFTTDLRPYDVVFCFLTPQAMAKLKNNFEQMKPGARLISYMFSSKSELFDQKSIDLNNWSKDKILIYRKK